jgi:broad specificity phosphatase PhoE
VLPASLVACAQVSRLLRPDTRGGGLTGVALGDEAEEGRRPRLYAVRHGQTAWSRQGRHTGRTDVPLEPAGRTAAIALGNRLAGLGFGLVLSSPLTRAAETARLAGFADRVEMVEDLFEWDYGDYEGLTTPEIRTQHPGWSLWTDGVPNGESVVDVGRRADRVIARVRSEGVDCLCFAHGHLLRALASRWVGLPAIAGRLWALDPAGIGVLGFERATPVIERWNEPPPQSP